MVSFSMMKIILLWYSKLTGILAQQRSMRTSFGIADRLKDFLATIVCPLSLVNHPLTSKSRKSHMSEQYK